MVGAFATDIPKIATEPKTIRNTDADANTILKETIAKDASQVSGSSNGDLETWELSSDAEDVTVMDILMTVTMTMK